MANKMKKCSSCGADIASNAKTCPQCGANNKKPIYKRWWVYAVLALIIIGIAAGGGDNAKQNGTNSSVNNAVSDPSGSASNTAENDPSAAEADEAEATSEPITYVQYNVTELFDALNSNAMKAEDTFKGQYVELHGFLGNIDSKGKYFGLGAGEDNYDYLFQEVQCYIKNDEQKNIIMEKNRGDELIVRGKITSIGEILGYSLDIDSIE